MSRKNAADLVKFVPLTLWLNHPSVCFNYGFLREYQESLRTSGLGSFPCNIQAFRAPNFSIFITSLNIENTSSENSTREAIFSASMLLARFSSSQTVSPQASVSPWPLARVHSQFLAMWCSPGGILTHGNLLLPTCREERVMYSVICQPQVDIKPTLLYSNRDRCNSHSRGGDYTRVSTESGAYRSPLRVCPSRRWTWRSTVGNQMIDI